MCDESDDKYSTELSEETLAILNDFLNNKDDEKISENWQLSQFWYDGPTVETLTKSVRKQCEILKNLHVALISCPTLYESIKEQGIPVTLFEFDKRFERFSPDYVFYDYNDPLNIDTNAPKEVKPLPTTKPPPPLLRSRTLPSIVVPGLNILQAQIDARYKAAESKNGDGGLQPPQVALFADDTSLQGHRSLIHHRLSSPEHSNMMADVMRNFPQHSSKMAKFSPNSSISNIALHKLAALLNTKSQLEAPTVENGPRRLSWERRESMLHNNNLKRSTSTDSISNKALPGCHSDPPTRKTPSPLINVATLNLSPSAISRRFKGPRALAVYAENIDHDYFGVELTEADTPVDTAGMDFWVDGFRNAAKKKLEKINKINIHQHALFSAVEHNQVEKVKTILESTDVDVNSVNADLLTPLDVAVLTSQKAVAKLLMTWGARPGTHFETPDQLAAHLRALMKDTEHHLNELIPTGDALNNNHTHFKPPASNSQPNVADKDKELVYWERRAALLKKMLLGYQQARPPDLPAMVLADVTGTNQITIRYQPPEYQDNGVCVRTKVQWSECESFDVISGDTETCDMTNNEIKIDGLQQGCRYWFRACCGNFKGFGLWRPSTPASLVPSSWRDHVSVEQRSTLSASSLESLFNEMRQLRPESAAEIKDFNENEKWGDVALCRKNPPKKKTTTTTIKQLFTANTRFHKNLKRGVFLSCLFYHEDKILLTNEDFLPCVEIDETYPGSYNQDFYWLMKVAATWDDVKSLKQDMEKNLASNANHFRIRMLQAVQQMQDALNTEDLGRLYYQPYKDEHGTLVFLVINEISSQKAISALNLRWVPLCKIQKKLQLSEESTMSDLLMASIPSQINYSQVSSVKLSRGLYLCYLKMRSCVDLIQIIIPNKTPNMLPYCKIRDNPHVSLDEWEWLKRINSRHKAADSWESLRGSDQQIIFVEQIANASRRLFKLMEVPLDEAMCHRLYDAEVIELTPSVSILAVVPPVESSCSAPGQQEALLLRGDFLGLPVQVFEMVHLQTYQPDIIAKYSRLSCLLELDLLLAQFSHREAFSTEELQTAKHRLTTLQSLQTQLNTTWKSARWIMSLIGFARDRSPSTAIFIRNLLTLSRKSKSSKDNHLMKRSLLHIPDAISDSKLPRAQMSRGSWPGDGVGFDVEEGGALSRSEQNLDIIFRLVPSKSQPLLPPPPPPLSVSASNSPILPPRHLTSLQTTDSLHSLSSDESTHAVVSLPVTTPVRGWSAPGSPMKETDRRGGLLRGNVIPVCIPMSGENEGDAVIQVYAAYYTGLSTSTSVQIRINPRTTARDVVDLVVKQLNMAVVLKGRDHPIYPPDHLGEFCLVAVIGARERCLRDDFKPLQLQNPWKKGRLYVRKKQDVLAALEHSGKGQGSAFL